MTLPVCFNNKSSVKEGGDRTWPRQIKWFCSQLSAPQIEESVPGLYVCSIHRSATTSPSAHVRWLHTGHGWSMGSLWHIVTQAGPVPKSPASWLVNAIFSRHESNKVGLVLNKRLIHTGRNKGSHQPGWLLLSDWLDFQCVTKMSHEWCGLYMSSHRGGCRFEEATCSPKEALKTIK